MYLFFLHLIFILVERAVKRIERTGLHINVYAWHSGTAHQFDTILYLTGSKWISFYLATKMNTYCVHYVFAIQCVRTRFFFLSRFSPPLMQSFLLIYFNIFLSHIFCLSLIYWTMTCLEEAKWIKMATSEMWMRIRVYASGITLFDCVPLKIHTKKKKIFWFGMQRVIELGRNACYYVCGELIYTIRVCLMFVMTDDNKKMLSKVNKQTQTWRNSFASHILGIEMCSLRIRMAFNVYFISMATVYVCIYHELMIGLINVVGQTMLHNNNVVLTFFSRFNLRSVLIDWMCSTSESIWE